MRSDLERLRDILEAIERIERYTGGRTEAFEKNELIQNWTVSHIQIIGEASNYVSKEVQAKYPEILWSKIIGMRNILVHNYFEISVAPTTALSLMTWEKPSKTAGLKLRIRRLGVQLPLGA